GNVIISVSDTGIGIPAEAIEKLGQEFFRASNARNESYIGTGLGLATVKQLLDHFNGGMQVESTLGAGSTFTISLPLTEKHQWNAYDTRLTA
ncbi:MAG: ATP-binding protein, partial [Chloroflexi bacterium]|nr:ATP-binding protein [Chloroflexota bacterium]